MLTNDNNVTIHVISDKKSLLRIGNQWNTLVNKISKNPFLLSEFTKEFLESTPKGWTPLILVISNNHTILGIAPLKTRQGIIGRYVDFLLPSWCSEFIFDEQHRNICMKYTFEFLFNTLKCKFASFSLPGDSINLISLKQNSEIGEIHLKTTSEMGRYIVPITSTWKEFEALLNRKFRKELRRVERNLGKMGLWTTIEFEGKEQSEITEKVFNVEKKSWKEPWRAKSGQTDPVLILVMNAAQQLVKTDSNFKWSVWFLELEGKILSYILVIKYKEVAYFVKTSYDEEYKKVYPGILIQNSAIKELFIEGKYKYIDFLSDLPYIQNWTNQCLRRVKVQLAKGIVPTIIQFMFENTLIKNLFIRVHMAQSRRP